MITIEQLSLIVFKHPYEMVKKNPIELFIGAVSVFNKQMHWRYLIRINKKERKEKILFHLYVFSEDSGGFRATACYAWA